MGRPLLATKMTRAEIQRRWRKRRRLGLVGRPPKTVPPDERAAVPPADLALIEDLTHQLDQSRRETEALRLELVAGIEPGAARPDDPGRCFYCLKRRDEVKAMLKASRRRFTVFTCNECIDRLRQESDEIIVRQTPAG
jgi:hypothetical protein